MTKALPGYYVFFDDTALHVTWAWKGTWDIWMMKSLRRILTKGIMTHVSVLKDSLASGGCIRGGFHVTPFQGVIQVGEIMKWGFIKNPVLSITSSGEIGFGEHDIEASKMQGKRAQGRAQDIPYQSISPYHHRIWRIFIECGKNPYVRKTAQGRSARGPILPKSNRIFGQPPNTSVLESGNLVKQ